MAQLQIERGKISIVIPCYNHGELLRETLSSVSRAKNENVCEVIIVDDGSTETKTCALMDELKNSEYRIIRQSNRGLGAARNTGIRNAKGEFILPLDSDNYLRKSYLKSGVEILRNQSAVGVVYGDAEYFENKTGRWIIPEFDFLRLAMGNFIDACALFRRQIWEEIGGYDEKMPHMGWEDWDFWLRTISYGWQFKHLDEIAFDYRVRACSMLQETNRHQSELTSYIFNKPENRILRLIRNQQIEIERLKVIEESKDYRLGRTLIQPARTIKTLFGKTGTISG